MGCNLRVERLLNRCPEVDCEDREKYPMVVGPDFSMMVHNRWGTFAGVAAYVFVRKPDGAMPYIEVYVWDAALEDKCYERFIICEGMCLPEEDERKLLGYARYGHLMPPWQDDMDDLNRDIQTFFPDWNYPGYDKMEIGVAIEHIYYASHRSGPKGILYRAGLNSIAYDLYEYESYNVIGSTPDEIIGHGVPEAALRILNQPWFTVYYLEGEELDRFAEVYKCFADRLGETLPSLGQWLYLEGLYEQARFGDEDFDKRVFENLAFLNKTKLYCGAVVNNLFGFLGLMDYLGVEIE